MLIERIGLIGFGAIGEEIYKKILKGVVAGYKIVGIFSDDISTKKIPKNIKCYSFDTLMKKKPNIIIEAAGVQACIDYAEKI